nr:uncharacterized mitochondrial protein AtMg00810-like [Tanacetum cinerariifolium]
MRPFGCPVTILNTKDHLCKYDGKADEGFFVRYSLNSKAFRVFHNRARIVEESLHVRYSLNSKAFRVFHNRARIVEESLHIRFSENTPNIARSGPNWLFDIDALTKLMNYKQVIAGNQSSVNANTKACDDVGKARMETLPGKDYILLPLWTADPLISQESKSSHDDGFQPSSDDEKKVDEDLRQESECKDQEKEDNVNNTNNVNAAGTNEVNAVSANINNELLFDPEMYRRGKIDKNLFIRRHKDDILLVQVCVDDIIFGSTKKELCNAFEKIMHDKFKISSMGELTFFLGLQVKQKKDVIFISQDKYVDEIPKKYGFLEVKNESTLMETQKPLLNDEDKEEEDVHMYRSMIGSLMYLTSSRPDIMFAVCACARYQGNPKVSHLYAVKRIFRYLKRHPKLGLWNPKDSIDLVAYTDSDYAGASLDKKSTTGGCQYLGCRLTVW